VLQNPTNSKEGLPVTTTIAQLAAVLQELFSSTAERIAKETKFVQRESPLTGAVFAQALVSAWLPDPQASEAQLAQAAAAVGVPITAQGLTARFTWPAAELMRRLLETAVSQVIAARRAAMAVLNRFNGVYIQDSTSIGLPEALAIMGCRWQIELLFKLRKSHGQVDQSRSEQPWRILTEVYAKLLAMVGQHRLFLVGHWSLFDRSLFKAAKVVRSHAMHLATHIGSAAQLEQVITTIGRCLLTGCRINKSRTAPRTYQRLKALEAGGVALLAVPPQFDVLSPAATATAYLG
jgi:hypothetical protein